MQDRRQVSRSWQRPATRGGMALALVQSTLRRGVIVCLGPGALGLGVGVAMDAAISSRETIHDRPGPTGRLVVSPLLSRERQGIFLSVGV